MGSRPLPNSDELAIQFVNTVAWRLRQPSEERLASPEALLVWLEQSGVLASSERGRLARAWKARPEDGTLVYRTALRFRGTVYALFIAHIKRQPPAASALTFLSEFVCCPRSRFRLVWADGRLRWRIPVNKGNAHDLLRPIALSAVELLTGTRAQAVKQCQDDRGCGWLFVDESRLKNRRWCSMGDCGNVAKARRHRERTRRADQEPKLNRR